MEYIKATEKDLEQVISLVQETIQTIYPKYYPKEVVDFFCELHNKDNIFRDIKAGFVSVLKNEIAQSNEKVCLDASLPACHLYEKRGYKTVKHE